MEHVDYDEDSEVMIGGQYLLSLLEKADIGPWFIIHGHKHFPEITYSSGSTSAPHTILSAGSLSARLHSNIIGRTANQFYLVDIDLDKTESIGRSFGTFKTYEWRTGFSWQPASSVNLPHTGGFGSQTTPAQLVSIIKNKFASNTPYLDSNDLIDVYEVMANFPPADFDRVVKKLNNFGHDVIIENGIISQIGAKK